VAKSDNLSKLLSLRRITPETFQEVQGEPDMSHEQSPTASSSPRSAHPRPPEHDSRGAWAAGGTVFAGMLLLIAGVMAILEGIVGIAKDSVYVVTRGDYTYKFDVSAWGWIHLVLGIIAVLVGYGVLTGAAWARLAGMAIAGLSMIANFMFLPYQPVWSVIMIAIDVFVIWALAVYPHYARGARSGGAEL
jgi:hypothetical protein